MSAPARPSRLRFAIGDAWATLTLLWADAPRTCTAICAQLPEGRALAVLACHARHSGAEALFLTPGLIRLGDENAVASPVTGDVLFGFEPAGICQHAAEDCSEVAWVYHDAAKPRRWISSDGDPANQRPPFETVDVALNLWAKVDAESGFYAASGRFPRTGEQPLAVTVEAWEGA